MAIKTISHLAPDYRAFSAPFLTCSNGTNLILAEDTQIALLYNSAMCLFEISSDFSFTIAGTLDTGSVAVGTDYYVYLCTSDGLSATIKTSASSTYPSGYDADSSRKIGGFHTLCVDVGTITDHDLTGYTAGQILPNSVWCLNHKPEGNVEGMVFDPGCGKWAMIYLASVSSGELVSVYGGTIADGTSTELFHWYKFGQWLAAIRNRFPLQNEFVSMSLGSNQGTNITGSADPVTTGGHTDTAGVRMISSIGCEDCCGALWQWGLEGGATNDVGSTWADAYDANDDGVAGQHYEAPNRALFGGSWADAASCGSRGSAWNASSLALFSSFGVRGVAEPSRG